MAGKNPGCSVFIGNLDEKVTDRVLYEIMVQAGRVVDVYIPKDKETNRPKGFAFAEYESEETAQYAVKLFSGLVSLNKRTLRFAISGQDNKSTSNLATSIQFSRSPHLSTPPKNVKFNAQSAQLMTPCRFSPSYPQTSFPPESSPGVTSNGHISSHYYNANDTSSSPMSNGFVASVNRSGNGYISTHPTSFRS